MRIGKLNGRFVVTWTDEAGVRRRYRLKALDKRSAEAEGRDIFRREATPPAGHMIAGLWGLYRQEKAARPIAETVGHTGKAVLAHFGTMRPDQVTVDDCRAYADVRKAAGRSVGTVWTELGHLRIVCRWAFKSGLIARVPNIELPQKPAPKDRWLTDAEIHKLLTADAEPHVRLAIYIMLTTAARVGAVLDLTWDRVDLARGQINLRVDQEGPRKGRAVVPINDTLRAALSNAAEMALSDHVIEWAGSPVKSIRKGFTKAVDNAELKGVSPHTLRHTAAVRMAAAGIPMQKIAQYLGHSNTSQTERVYARYAPDHLRDAADALEFGALRVVK
jgi:integrase